MPAVMVVLVTVWLRGSVKMAVTVQKSKEFTIDGTFTVPVGVTGVFLTMIGGGGGGASSYQGQNGNGATGGAAGELLIRFPLRVTPGDVIPVLIGAGGVQEKDTAFTGTPGGNTSFGTTVALGARLVLTGGGPRGGVGTAPPSYGDSETPAQFGGSGGGRGGASGVPPSGGHDGTAGNGSGGLFVGGGGGLQNGGYGGGGGGAGTIWGPGGDGGRGNGQGGSGNGPSGNTGGHPSVTNGLDAPGSSYGAGGGGAGGCNSAFSGNSIWSGAGAPGYCLVEWYEEIP